MKHLPILKIVADSRYVLDNIKHLGTWKKNNWTTNNGHPVLNREIWEDIQDLIFRYEIMSTNKLQYSWTKGHSGCPFNQKADILATRGRLLQCKGHLEEFGTLPVVGSIEPKESAKKRKKKEVSLKLYPLLACKKWFFYTNVNPVVNDKHVYYTVSYEDKDKKDEENKKSNKYLGKQDANSCYVVIILGQQLEPVEFIRDIMNGPEKVKLAPVLVDLAFIGKAAVWDKLCTLKQEFLKLKKHLLIDADNNVVATIVYPPKLVFQLQEYFEHGVWLYNNYFDQSKKLCSVFEITETILEKNKKSFYVIKPIFNNSEKILTVSVDGYVDVRLIVGIDIPHRTCLSNLIKHYNGEIKIYLVVYEDTKRTYRVASIIDHNTNTGVYFNPHSNLRLKGEPI